MNAFYLVGRVMDVPEVVETANGIKYCRLKMSVIRNNRDGDEQNEIFEVSLFRNLAEEKFVKDGYVAVNGRIQANNYDKDGTLYYNCKLIGNSVTLFDQ